MKEGYIANISPGRIRIKFPSEKGNYEFFNLIIDKIQNANMNIIARANVLTGSLILEHEAKLDDVMNALNNFSLFKIVEYSPSKNFQDSISKKIGFIEKITKKITSDSLDLKSLIFIFLLLSALYQIVRGNFSSIPWYTALFYLNALINKK